jgi:4-hydroxy-2-oxoheptanedioate aldolase
MKNCIGAMVSALALTAALPFAAVAQAQSPAAAPPAPQNNIHINRSIETLAKGDSIFGLFSGDFSLANARALARSNLDYVLIDMEHTAFSMETLQEFLLGMTDKQAIARQGNTQMRTTPFVRIPVNGRNDPEWIVKQVLDIGVMGIMFPYIESGDEARRAVSAMRYPQARGAANPTPTGVRGSSPAVATWYWGVPGYTQRADVWPLNPQGELLAIMQIESAKGVENAEAIITTSGVGFVFLGPSDLSMSMGLPGSHPEVQAAIAKVLDLCKKHRMPCGTLSSSTDAAAKVTAGWRASTVGYWGDAGIGGDVEKALGLARAAAGRKD